MRAHRIWLIWVALGGVSCSQSAPTIGIEQLEGEYRSGSCPPITVRNALLVTSSGQTSFDLARIKRDDILSTAATPRVSLSGGCDVVVVPEPSYIFVERADGRIAFDVFTLDRAHAVRFYKTGDVQ